MHYADTRTAAASESKPGSRLPKFAKPENLAMQLPPSGPFNSSALAWTNICDNGKYSLVAAIPFDRLADFEQSEGEVGNCVLNSERSFKKATDGVLQNSRCACYYAAPEHKSQRQRQQLEPDLSPQPLREGTKARKGKLQNNTSAKLGCKYQFFAKRYSKRADTVILKFACEEHDTPQTCVSMQHVPAAGQPPLHQDLDLHLQVHTQEMRDFVLPKLKDHIKPALILQGMLSCHL